RALVVGTHHAAAQPQCRCKHCEDGSQSIVFRRKFGWRGVISYNAGPFFSSPPRRGRRESSFLPPPRGKVKIGAGKRGAHPTNFTLFRGAEDQKTSCGC